MKRGSALFGRHCEEHLRRSNPACARGSGSLRGVYHRAGVCTDPLARNDGLIHWTDVAGLFRRGLLDFGGGGGEGGELLAGEAGGGGEKRGGDLVDAGVVFLDRVVEE